RCGNQLVPSQPQRYHESKHSDAAPAPRSSPTRRSTDLDTAKLTGAANGPLNEATIEYAFYSGESCSGTPTSETPIPNTFTSPGPIPQSNANTFENAGKFSWKAIYSGDANNEKAESPCNEILVVGKNSPTLSTELNNETKNTKAAAVTTLSAAIGDKVFDTAKLTGAASGPATEAKIEYAFYSNSTCTENKEDETPSPNTFTTGGTIPNSKTFTFTQAGTYYWKAVYSGDANNEKAEGPYNETLVGGTRSPSLRPKATDAHT